MSRGRSGVIGLSALALALLLGCEQIARDQTLPPAAGSLADARQGSLQAGPEVRRLAVHNPYDRDREAIRVGERLYGWYNCGGCHGGYGGGGIGPPFLNGERDAALDYDYIYAGRPGGMPAYGGRVPDQQIWQIIAYIQALNRGEIQVPRVPSEPAPEEGSHLARGAP